METEESLRERIVALYTATPQLEPLFEGMVDLYAQCRVAGLAALAPDDVSNDLLELCWGPDDADEGRTFVMSLARQLVFGPPQRVVRIVVRGRYAAEDIDTPSEGDEICEGVGGVALFRQLLQFSPEIEALGFAEPIDWEMVTEGG